MSSRERLLAAIDGLPGAPVPCSFMMFRALREQCRDEYEFAARQLDLGLDTRMRLDDLPVRFAPEVQIREWVELRAGEAVPVVTRMYETPAGTLTSAIRQSYDWPYGDRVPLFGDHLTPRATVHPVSEPEHLAALRYLLTAPTDDDIAAFLDEAARRRRFAADRGLLFCGGWRGERDVPGEDNGLVGDNFSTVSVVDTLMWLCGGTEPLIWAYEEPDFLEELIGIVDAWNRRRLEVHLSAGVELVFRRAWYEGTDFWSPHLYRRFILPTVRRDAQLAHQAGARYGYIITSGMAAIADQIVEAGVDVIVGVDPGQGKGTTLSGVRETLGGRVGLWGGISGPLVVEAGGEQGVCHAVEQAMAELAPTGRFILSPVDNIRARDARTWANVHALISTWRALFSSKNSR